VALDPVSTVLLDVFDGQATIGEIAHDVVQELGIDHDSAFAHIRRVAYLMDSSGLLVGSVGREAAWADPPELIRDPNH
jgi:hypothetical protein